MCFDAMCFLRFGLSQSATPSHSASRLLSQWNLRSHLRRWWPRGRFKDGGAVMCFDVMCFCGSSCLNRPPLRIALRDCFRSCICEVFAATAAIALANIAVVAFSFFGL